MALVPIDLHKCPHCQEAVEIRVAGVCSGLGPSRRACRRCGHVFSSDRREWLEMTAAARRRFVLWSLAYVLLGGLVGGAALQGAVRVLDVGFRQGWIPQVNIKDATFWVGFGAWVGILGLVQVLRVAASVRRARPRAGQEEKQPPVPLFVLQFGWHIPFTMLLVTPLLVGWIVAILSRF